MSAEKLYPPSENPWLYNFDPTDEGNSLFPGVGLEEWLTDGSDSFQAKAESPLSPYSSTTTVSGPDLFEQPVSLGTHQQTNRDLASTMNVETVLDLALVGSVGQPLANHVTHKVAATRTAPTLLISAGQPAYAVEQVRQQDMLYSTNFDADWNWDEALTQSEALDQTSQQHSYASHEIESTLVPDQHADLNQSLGMLSINQSSPTLELPLAPFNMTVQDTNHMSKKESLAVTSVNQTFPLPLAVTEGAIVAQSGTTNLPVWNMWPSGPLYEAQRNCYGQRSYTSAASKAHPARRRPVKPRNSSRNVVNATKVTKKPKKSPQAQGQHIPGPLEELDRDTQDRILLSLRAQGPRGVPYKEIKTRLGFKGKVGTLRTRHRTLILEPGDRPRKAEWDAKAEQGLMKAVEILAPNTARVASHGNYDRGSKGPLTQVPWEKVTKHMNREWGIHKYGPGTAKKKYVEIIERQLVAATTSGLDVEV